VTIVCWKGRKEELEEELECDRNLWLSVRETREEISSHLLSSSPLVMDVPSAHPSPLGVVETMRSVFKSRLIVSLIRGFDLGAEHDLIVIGGKEICDILSADEKEIASLIDGSPRTRLAYIVTSGGVEHVEDAVTSGGVEHVEDAVTLANGVKDQC
jgi:hypothetical protein